MFALLLLHLACAPLASYAPPSQAAPSVVAPVAQGGPVSRPSRAPEGGSRGNGSVLDARVEEAAFSDADEKKPEPDSLRISRGQQLLPLWIPRDEELTFDVVIDLGVLGDPEVGRVTLSSGVDAFVAGLPLPGAAAPKARREVGWIRSLAEGSYMGYLLHHELYARLLPQEWPSTLYNDTQSGSENRRRVLKLGLTAGELTSVYQSDGHCKGCENREHFVQPKWLWGKAHHCDKCKLAEHRKWKDPESRRIPAGAVDMLSAVYLARSMVREGWNETSFALVDRQKLWTVNLTRGRRKRIETPAGTFDCQEVKLFTAVPEGEPHDKDGFEGMFGIRGTIQIWMQVQSGVPVLIAGTLPVPVLGDLDVRVELKKFRGTPAMFVPQR